MPSSTEPRFGEVWEYGDGPNPTIWLAIAPRQRAVYGALGVKWIVLYLGTKTRQDGASLMKARIDANSHITDEMDFSFGIWRKVA